MQIFAFGTYSSVLLKCLQVKVEWQTFWNLQRFLHPPLPFIKLTVLLKSCHELKNSQSDQKVEGHAFLIPIWKEIFFVRYNTLSQADTLLLQHFVSLLMFSPCIIILIRVLTCQELCQSTENYRSQVHLETLALESWSQPTTEYQGYDERWGVTAA